MKKRGLMIVLLALATANLAAQQADRPPRPPFPTIQDAARAGDLTAVAQFLERGVDVNDQHRRSGETPLLSALLRQQADVADFLIEQGADPTRVNVNGTTALQVAARYNLVELIPKLVQAGARPNQPGFNHRAPLHEAAERGHAAAIELLLELGAWPNFRPRKGSYPLDLALQQPKVAAVQALIDGGAHLMEPFKAGQTRVNQAARFGWKDVVDAALAEVATPEQRQQVLEIALDGACLGGHPDLVRHLLNLGGTVDRKMVSDVRRLDVAAEQGHPQLVQAFIDAGADPKSPSGPGGWSALHFAAANSAPEVARILLDRGADPNSQDKLGRTPLHLAARFGNTQTMTAIIRGGGDLDAADVDGNTPLHLATMHGQIQAVKALLQAGADPDLPNADGVSAQRIARSAPDNPMVDLFPKARAAVRSLPPEARFLVQLLQRQDARATRSSIDGRVRNALQAGQNPLDVLLRQKNLSTDLIQEFVDEYPDAITQRNSLGYRPIHVAAESAEAGAIEMLLAHGAGVNDQDNPARWTPLHFAVSGGNPGSVALLLDQGADPSRGDALGQTPRDLARALGRAELFESP